jgi:predicted transcriptional regulator
METSTITVRVPLNIKEQLGHLAEATHRSKSWLAADALSRYLELNAWQVAEIQQGLREATDKDFATEEEVEAVFTRWPVE